MKSPSAALQIALVDALMADPAITVPIVGSTALPEAFPCIIVGEDQEIRLGEVARRYFEVYSTVHAWTRDRGMLSVKELGSAIVGTVNHGLASVEGIHFHDIRLESARYLRDPNPEIAHGVITFRAIVEVLP